MKTKHFLLIITLVLLSGVLSACSGSISASSWPGYTIDGDSNSVYLAYNTNVYALDLNNGSVKWSFPEKPSANQTFYAAPVLSADGQLITAGYDKTIHSLNSQTGKENWAFQQAENRFISSPAVTEQAIFAPSADGNLYAIDLNKNPIWSDPFSASQPLWASPTLSTDGNTLYVAGMDRKLYAVSASNGTTLWEIELGGASVGSPTLDENGLLYLGTFGKEMLVINSANGEILRRIPSEGWIWGSPLVSEGTLFYGDLEGYFYSVDANGQTIWSIQPDGPISGTPILVGESILFGTESGTLYAIDRNGSTLWNRPVGGKLYAGPQAVGDLILVAPIETDALLVAFDVNGNQKWSFIPEG